MLLLVHQQKTVENGVDDSDSFTAPSNKVLVVHPHHRMDLSSNVIVSDSNITTASMHVGDNNHRTPKGSPGYNRRVSVAGMATANLGHNPHNTWIPLTHSHQHVRPLPPPPMSLSRSTSSPSSLSLLSTTIKSSKGDASVLWEQHPVFLERLGSNLRTRDSHPPLRRHSHFGLTLTDNNSNSFNNISLNQNQKLAQHLGTRRASLPIASSQSWTRPRSWSRPCRSRSRSPTTRSRASSTAPYAMGSSRSFRDAFKKAMTVRSPVLTSTSSGMGTLSNASSSSLTFMPELGLEPLLIETKQGEEAVQEEEDGKESEEIWGTRTSLTDILGEDRSNILANEIDQGESTTKAKVKVKREILDDAMSGILYDVQKDDIANTSAKMMKGLKVETTNSTRQQIIQASDGVTVLDEEKVEGNRAKEKEKRQQEACPSMPSSVMQTPTGSIAGLNKCSTSQASSPAQTFSRSPSMSPSPSPSYLSLSHNQEEHVTAHDISLMTASFGALTPLEIQNRFYAQKQQQQQRRRRNSRRKSIISKSRSNYHQSLTAPNIPTVFDPTKVLALRHQLRQHQSGAEPSIHPFDRPPQAAAQGLPISEVSKSPELKSNPGLGKGTSSLPSYYYLPPSAFRMAADVEAEERQEAEQKRQEKDKELEEYFVFLSPML